MTCPVLCICSSITFLSLVSVVSRSSVGGTLGTFDLLKWLILQFYALCKPKNMHFYAVWRQKILHFLAYSVFYSTFAAVFEPYYILILSLLYPYYVLLLCRLLPVQNFYLFLFGLSLYKFACLFYASLSIFYTSLYLFYLPCVFFTQNLFQKRHNSCFLSHSSLPGTTIIYVRSY